MPKRPWIVLYMTHPYLVSNDEDKVQWFVMNDTNRFFEILKRYKVGMLFLPSPTQSIFSS